MKKIEEIKKDFLLAQMETLKNNGLTKVYICEKLGVVPQYLQNVTKGNRGISDSFLDKFIEAFGISHFDLFETSPKSSSSDKEHIIQLEYLQKENESLKKSNDRLMNLLESQQRMLEANQKQNETNDVKIEHGVKAV